MKGLMDISSSSLLSTVVMAAWTLQGEHERISSGISFTMLKHIPEIMLLPCEYLMWHRL